MNKKEKSTGNIEIAHLNAPLMPNVIAKATDFLSYEAASPVDLRNISIDTSKSVVERVKDFLEQVGDPYLFKVGDITVKVRYGDGKTVTDAIAAVFQTG